MATVDLHDISKTFGDVRALHPLTLHIREGEFFSLLGPSGCGKTTLLRIISGLESPSSGEVQIDGLTVTAISPQKRNVGIVFQNYALFPHMTAFQNVAYGLEVKKMPGSEIRRRVEDILQKVHLLEKANVPVPLLSGGEQQRVAVARAVIVEPRILLFDEPLSNLDYALRLETRAEIKRLQRDVGITTIYVTHDQGEALALSDRVAVMSKGVIEQIGTPDELYFHPRNAFIATFIGHANLFSASISREYFGVSGIAENEVLAVLPEEIVLSNDGGKAKGKISTKEFSGANVEFTIDFLGQSVKAHRPSVERDFTGEIGSDVSLSIDASVQRKVKDE